MRTRPQSQRRALRGIERNLSASDPQLARLFLNFNRLGGDDTVPSAEQLGGETAGHAWHRAWARAIVCCVVALALACAALAVVSAGGLHRCSTTATVLQELSRAEAHSSHPSQPLGQKAHSTPGC
jgi:Protein of unknown function (DUF3040)